MRCGSGLSKGLCLICASRYGNNPNPNSLNDSPNISENVSQSPPLIDHHCCYECEEPLDGFFCQQCTCKSCGNGAHYGYNCPPQVPIISNPEPCNNQTVDELPQTLPSFDPTCYSGEGNLLPYVSKPNFVDDSPNVFNLPPQPPTYSYEFCGNDAHYGHDCPPQVPFIYNPEPCYNQDFNFPQNFQCFQQQYICCTRCGGPHETFQCQQVIFYEPCCENCGGPHETFQCQPMNYYEPNLCYESNYSGFDHFQPPQYSVIHQPPPIQEKTCAELLAEERAANIDQSPPQEMSIQDMEDLKQHYLDEMKSLINDLQIQDYRNERMDIQYRRECEIKIDELKQNFNGMSIEIRKKEKELMQQEQAAYVRTSQRFNFIYYDDDEDEESSILLSDVISELPPCVAITPVFSTEEPDNSLSMGDEHLDTIPATESDEVIKSSVEDLVLIPSESEGISDKMCDASPPHSELVSLEEVKDFHPEDGELEDDILCEKLSKINFLIAKIEALKDNPTPSYNFVTKSPSTSPNSFLEETNISYNSLPESETFCFNLEEKSSGNPTSYTNLSLPDYEALFCDSEPDLEDFTMDSFVIKSPIPVEDGNSFLEKFETTPELETFKFDIEEKNSGSTTIHADISLSYLECVYFKSEPDLGDLTSIDPGIRENVSSTTNVNLPFEDDQSPLFAYVVWIFLSFLTYPVAPPYLLSSRNEDTIFDPCISIYHSFMPGVSHRSGTFMKSNVYPNQLNESPMEILSFTCFLMDQ
ncbi:hypothetical protein Tco_1304843 [Tanacetum coccineum]